MADDNAALTEALAKGLHLASPLAMGSILTRGEYEHVPHLAYINDSLVRSIYGLPPMRRIITAGPPRHGKSELISVWFPTWRLAHRPKETIGIICHTHILARDWGLKIRKNMEEFFPELGIELSDDSDAAARWRTKDGGGVVCFGVGGSPIGIGFDCAIIDDPYRNAEDAESDTVSDSVWKTYQWVTNSRLEPKATIVITHQRWNNRDLIARLLAAKARGPEAEGYEDWRTIILPALAKEDDPLGRKPGEALWPQRYDEEALHKKLVSQGPYAFSAMFQQDPVPAGGGVFKHSLWNYWVPRGDKTWAPVRVDGRDCTVRQLPESFDAVIQSWDMNFLDDVRAMQMGRETDPVAGHVWGRKGADYYLLDRTYGRFGLTDTIIEVRAMSAQWPQAVGKLIEPAANGPAVVARLRHEISGFIMPPARGSKMSRVRQIQDASSDDERAARALSMEAALVAGNFWIPHPDHRAWSEEYRTLMGQFPKGGRDDTDATSQAWAFLVKGQWQQLQKAHAEALRMGTPINDVHAAFKARIQEMTRKQIEASRGLDPKNIYWR